MPIIASKKNQGPIIKMRIGIELELSRMLTDTEYDHLERAGISVYGSGDGKDARYELGCHNSKELSIAEKFLSSLR